MLGVTFNLGRPAHVTFNEKPCRNTGGAHRGRVKKRIAGHHLFGLADVGNDNLFRLNGAPGRPGERYRCTHQCEEAPPGRGVVPVRRAVGKFVFNESAKLLSRGKFIETPPILYIVHRWQVTQSVRLWILYSETSFGPISS